MLVHFLSTIVWVLKYDGEYLVNLFIYMALTLF